MLIGLENICEVLQDIGAFNMKNLKLIPEILFFFSILCLSSVLKLYIFPMSHVEMYYIALCTAVDSVLLLCT